MTRHLARFLLGLVAVLSVAGFLYVTAHEDGARRAYDDGVDADLERQAVEQGEVVR